MTDISKTLFIPLYGKAFVSRQGIILEDKKAEEIWADNSFPLKGRSASVWLAYYMSMRAKVFDERVSELLAEEPGALAVHIGCGLDSRALRIGSGWGHWTDIDFPDVIEERRKYYDETDNYSMVSGNALRTDWVSSLPKADSVIVIMEGVSMYLDEKAISSLFGAFEMKYGKVHILMDAYTTLGAKMSRYRNPINDVGVRDVYGTDDPGAFIGCGRLGYKGEHSMTPDRLVEQLRGIKEPLIKSHQDALSDGSSSVGSVRCTINRGFLRKKIFKIMFAGSFARRLYRLYEYSTEK